MELIARELKALGLYAARSLSFDGVAYEPLNHELTAADIEIWNAWADAYQIIHRHLQAALKATGRADDDGASTAKGAKNAALSAFASCQQRFFGGLLSGVKTPTLVRAIHDAIDAGESAVVQIVTTNEAVMERKLAAIPPAEWNNLTIDLSGKDQVLDYLMNAFPVHQMTTIEDPDSNEILVAVTDEEGRAVLSQEALALREDLVTRLALLPSVMGVLDSLLEAFGPTAIAEITGRTRRVVSHDGRRIVERRGASAAKAETDAFMSGRKRILVFSDAGGTGRSYHADLAAKNQDKRRHFLAEPGWRADVAIQGLGRTHRTNQASAPIFCPVTTSIQGERRFLSTIARRLDSLGALTRGERRASSNGLFRAEDNLESSWAHSALTHFYAMLAANKVPEWTVEALEDKTALAILDGDKVLLPSDRLPPMHTFLNRLLALRIDDQNSLFETFAKLLAAIVERAEQAGLLDHGLEDIVADDLTVLSEEVLRTDLGTGAQTRLVRFAIRTPWAIRNADDALVAIAPFDPAAVSFVVNAKSGRAAIAIAGHTTTDDNHDLIQAVRMLRPTEMTVAPAAAYGESSWETVDPAVWRATWDAEVLGLDPFHTRELNLITGVLLPVWKFMPQKRARVRRIKAPEGRQWLGRSLQDGELATLKAELGLTDIATEMAASGMTEKLVLEQTLRLRLQAGSGCAGSGSWIASASRSWAGRRSGAT